MEHSEIIRKFYDSPLGFELRKSVGKIMCSFLEDDNQKILLIGQYDAYLKIFKNHNFYDLAALTKNETIKFKQIFLFHCCEYENENCKHFFNKLKKHLCDGGEIVILSAKLYSIESMRMEWCCKNFFFETKIMAALKGCGFIKVKKWSLLDRYFAIFKIPIFAKFVVIHATIDDSCKVSIGDFEPVA